jgi:hypothetical protein
MLITLHFKYPNRDHKSCFFFKGLKIKTKNHFLTYKRSPKGFKYGKQRVSFFNSSFKKSFFVRSFNCNLDNTVFYNIADLTNMFNLYGLDCEPNVNLWKVSFTKRIKIVFVE